MLKNIFHVLYVMSGKDHLWAIVSSIDHDANPSDVLSIKPKITELVDNWHARGKIMLSGPFDNETSSMTVVAADENEARDFFKRWNDICSGFLVSELYRWDAMPILSVLTK